MADRPSDDIAGLPPVLSELPWSTDFVMQAIEILPVAASGGSIEFWRPSHADSFIVGWPAGARPEYIARTTLEQLELSTVLLHSTSWRHGGGEVVLTYLAVVAGEVPEEWHAEPVGRADLARGDATTPPPVIGIEQVLEHGLRHLAWLLREDPVVLAVAGGWRELLAAYEPEPFRALGPPG